MTDSSPSAVGRSVVLERTAELAALARLVADLRPGTGRVAVVQGPPGIGKTTLVGALHRAARGRGLPMLTARGTELGMDISFRAAQELFAVFGEPPAALSQPDDARNADETGRATADATVARTGDFAVLQKLFDLTLRVSGGRGLVLVIDDCHWLDSPSLRFLAFLTAKIEQTDVLLFLTSRPNSDPGRTAVLEEILSSRGVVTLTPQLLSRRASDDLLAELLTERPDPTFAAVCFRETDGNPLMLVELAAAMRDAQLAPTAENAALVGRIGSHAVKHRVREQLSRLTDPEVAVLNAIAVLGDGSRSAQIEALVGDAVEPTAAVAVLLRAGLIRGDLDAGLDFAHPLIRAAVYDLIEPELRAQAHRRAARLLTDAHAGVESVAAHYVAVPVTTPAAESGSESASLTRADAGQSPELMLMRAAAQAMRRGHRRVRCAICAVVSRLRRPHPRSRDRQPDHHRRRSAGSGTSRCCWQRVGRPSRWTCPARSATCPRHWKRWTNPSSEYTWPGLSLRRCCSPAAYRPRCRSSRASRSGLTAWPIRNPTH